MFAARAAGVVVLKPLSNALADGDPIYAVIRGSAVNQDGRSNGLMAPNPSGPGGCSSGRLPAGRASRPATVQLRGSARHGHVAGRSDRGESAGRSAGRRTSPGTAVRLGSVKTNLGHLEAAAGIAGLIKVALSLRHREIPPSLHFETPNPHIAFDQLSLRVQTALTSMARRRPVRHWPGSVPSASAAPMRMWFCKRRPRT